MATSANPIAQTVFNLLGHAAKLAETGDFASAGTRLGEASMVLERERSDDDPEWHQLSARVYSGLGQLALRMGNLDEAQLQLTQSLSARSRSEALGATPEHLSAAVAHINLSSTLGHLKQVDAAIAHSEQALARLQKSDDPAAMLYEVATLQGLGQARAASGDVAGAGECYLTAIERTKELAASGVDDIADMSTQLKIMASINLFEQDRYDDAHALGAEAVNDARDEHMRSGSEEALGQYATAQMNHVAFCEAIGAFAGAEDALFHVLELVGPQPDVIKRGRQLYTEMLKLDDALLERGNLPRDEVKGSLAELDRMEAAAAEQSA